MKVREISGASVYTVHVYVVVTAEKVPNCCS